MEKQALEDKSHVIMHNKDKTSHNWQEMPLCDVEASFGGLIGQIRMWANIYISV